MSLLIFLLLLVCIPVAPQVEFQCGCRTYRTTALWNMKRHADCSQCSANFTCLAQLDLSSLDLSNTGLQKVPDLSDPGFGMIEELNLSGNEITQLANWKFGSMEKLDFVNMSCNNLTSLPNKKPLCIKIDLSYNLLEQMTDLVPLVKTKAILTGNSWRCMCNNSLVKHMYKVFPSFMDNNIVCKKDDSDELQPFAMQCHEIIHDNYDDSGRKSFYIGCIIFVVSVALIFFCFLKKLVCFS
ncbi:hypothetical protein KR074_008723 [Drosophila pseudoananassae]|nr:hypothetical protein KR074_008723 [Drosophila pseudoananassae]